MSFAFSRDVGVDVLLFVILQQSHLLYLCICYLVVAVLLIFSVVVIGFCFDLFSGCGLISEVYLWTSEPGHLFWNS